MSFLACGTLIVNDIFYADGHTTTGQPGGAVIYALEGLKFLDDDAVLVAGCGKDFDEFFGRWMDDNHLTRAGLEVRDEKCLRLGLRYEPDGRWFHESDTLTEQQIEEKFSLMGDDIEHLCRMLPGCEGVYLTQGPNLDFFDRIFAEREKHGFKIMWEIPTQVLIPKNEENIYSIIKRCDLYSVNLPETKTLFHVTSEEQAIERMIQLGTPCFYRVGERGAYLVRDGRAVFEPSAAQGKPVDPTGCGNCSTAACLAAFCKGYSDREVVRLANLAAGYNVLQNGLYPVITKELRKKLFSAALQH